MLESDSVASSATEPGPWGPRLDVYLDEASDSWVWGYQVSAMSRSLGCYSDRRKHGGCASIDVDRLLMTWQLLRAFRPEYSCALLSRLRLGVLEGR